ncbi:MAG: tRNA-dihydrouridine synthase family protein [Chitinivibrionales bacterium]|nr:tRNA-dihydrouridine synthase family protein [Chitinivibrionales bacterium]
MITLSVSRGHTQCMPLVLGPLRGITDCVFRTAYTRHFGGFDSALAPFVSTVRGVGVARSHLHDLLPEHNPLLTVVPQVIGNDADQLVNSINALADLGYDTVDWNLGCPFAKVTRKRRGAGLLSHPDTIAAQLDSVLPRITCRLSIKTRLGFASTGDLEQLMPRLAMYPLASLTIHARTAAQMYEGDVDLDAFERCLALAAVPVVYNGDIVNVEGFEALRARFGTRVAGWMIARGAVADPFLPAVIRGAPYPPASEAVERIRAFHEELFDSYRRRLSGPGPLFGRMKELWRLLGGWFADGDRLVGKLCRTQSEAAYRRAVDRLLAQPPRAWQHANGHR